MVETRSKAIFYVALAFAALAVFVPSGRAADITGCTNYICGGNQVSGLEVFENGGLSPLYLGGGFNWSTTSYALQPIGPQATAPMITITTGNNYSDVSITFAVNGHALGASATASPTPFGISYTTDPFALVSGTNVVTITVTDPFPVQPPPYGVQPPMVYTVTIPYTAAFVTNAAPPTLSGDATVGSTLSCSSGSWTSAPLLNSVGIVWQRSTDGSTWSTLDSTSVGGTATRTVTRTVTSSDAGGYIRCQATGRNDYATATPVNSASSALIPVPAPTTTTTQTTSTPAPTTPTPTTSAPTTTTTPSTTNSTGNGSSTPVKVTTTPTTDGGSAITATLTLAPSNIRARSLASAISAKVGITITVGPKTVYLIDNRRATAHAVSRAITRARTVTLAGTRVGHSFLATKITLR